MFLFPKSENNEWKIDVATRSCVGDNCIHIDGNNAAFGDSKALMTVQNFTTYLHKCENQK